MSFHAILEGNPQLQTNGKRNIQKHRGGHGWSVADAVGFSAHRTIAIVGT